MYERERWILREWKRKEEMLGLVQPSLVIVRIIFDENIKSHEFDVHN
jgi:hypothetical protein